MALPMADSPGLMPSPQIGKDPDAKNKAKKNESFNNAVSNMVSDAMAKGSGSTKDPLVYLGYTKQSPTNQISLYQPGMQPMPGTPTLGKQTGSGIVSPDTRPLSSVKGDYYDWDNKTKNKFLSQLNLAGYDTSKMRDSDVAGLWGAYAEQASAYYAQGKTLTPWDILAKDRAQREAYVSTPRTVTSTSTSYDMSTAADAEGMFNQAAQSLLGRAPTKSEIAAFQKSLNKYEKANPTVTTQTTNYLGDEVTGQTSESSGGVTDVARNTIASNDIKADPEYGAYQASTTYFNALMQMIGS